MSFKLLLTDLRTLEPVLDETIDLANFPPASWLTAPTISFSKEDGGGKEGFDIPAPGLSENLAYEGGGVVSGSARYRPPPQISNDLADEGWGVVVPDGPGGEERLAWMRPLLELRQQQCGPSKLQLMRTRPGLRSADVGRWCTEYEARHPNERPGYLLLLGDLDELPLELQQRLMGLACVGRLCFTTLDGAPDRAGYEAYCAKVCRTEAARNDWDADARLLFYASRDGSDASAAGYLDLIRRCEQYARADERLSVQEVKGFGSTTDHQWYTREPDLAARERTLVHWAEMHHPAVLMSMTHGAGSHLPAEQRLCQGTPVLGEADGPRRREVLDHGSFTRGFLPGGFWFLNACFGAGTPTTSVYQPLFDELYRLGMHNQDPRMVLKYLAPERPFVARLPQLVLAHPDGPLGICGHVDLAWTFGFQRLDEGDDKTVIAEHGPYYDVVRDVVNGARFGLAVAGLREKAEQIAIELRLAGGVDDTRRMQLAWQGMRLLDLSGYILLGDPAAQIPTRQARVTAGTIRPRTRHRGTTSLRLEPRR